MKKYALLFGAATVVALSGIFASCSNKPATDADGNLLPTASDSLRVALANQDSLLVLMNEISDGMTQIRQLENILASTSVTGDTPSRRTEIRNDMQAIQKALEERRQRLEELEKKLKQSNNNNALLQKSIASLKEQIAQQEQTIEGLRNELADANVKIERLSGSVDSLNVAVANVTGQKEKAEEANVNLTNELNTVHYLVGSSKELKEAGVLKGGGFLRSAKINPAEFKTNLFTTADKRNLKVIPLYSKKAKVMTSQPEDSYQINTLSSGEKELQILNANKFWNASNYLVVKTD